MPSWANWGRTYACRPETIEHPPTEEEIRACVRRASARGRRVRVAGSGHSFTDIACTDDVMLRLDRYNRVLAVDREAMCVTVQAGITIRELGERLASAGLAMSNLGDIGYQAIAGATATATHGTGAKFGNLATQVRAMRLVLADGSTLDCSDDADPEMLAAARVNLGALGVVSTMTLQCEPAFNLRAAERPRRLDELLEEMDSLVDGNEHFEFFWFPHTAWALTKANNRTTDQPPPEKRWKTFLEDYVLENYLFGAICRLGKLHPAWTPALARLLAKGLAPGRKVRRSDLVFTTPRLVRFAEMEYAIPRQACAEALRRLRAMIDERGFLVSFPVEVRFVAPDDIFLSPANGRETCYIAVHMYRGLDYQPYFRAVEAIMRDHGGRPHWGKLHFRTAADLAPAYPAWERFAAVRAKLDPEGRFSNAYVDRVLGPASG